MKTIPEPRYGPGPQTKRLTGSSAPAHFLFLDACAIHKFQKAVPNKPNERQAALLNSLAPSSGNNPVNLVTTPLELMICDFIKEAYPTKKGKAKMRMVDFARVGWGQLVIKSHGSLRTDWYLYQPFTMENVSVLMNDTSFSMN